MYVWADGAMVRELRGERPAGEFARQAGVSAAPSEGWSATGGRSAWIPCARSATPSTRTPGFSPGPSRPGGARGTRAHPAKPRRRQLVSLGRGILRGVPAF